MVKILCHILPHYMNCLANLEISRMFIAIKPSLLLVFEPLDLVLDVPNSKHKRHCFHDIGESTGTPFSEKKHIHTENLLIFDDSSFTVIRFSNDPRSCWTCGWCVLYTAFFFWKHEVRFPYISTRIHRNSFPAWAKQQQPSCKFKAIESHSPPAAWHTWPRLKKSLDLVGMGLKFGARSNDVRRVTISCNTFLVRSPLLLPETSNSLPVW